MKSVVCAANPIKETLTAGECLKAFHAAVGELGEENFEFSGFLISDGGDGFLDAARQSVPVETLIVECTGPLGDVITAPVLYSEMAHAAYIESAACIGLRLVEPARRDLMMSGSAGLADLVAAARNRGAHTVYIGLGGTATCDGGVGFLWKLGCHAGLYSEGQGCENRAAIDLADCAPPDLQLIQEWLGPCQLIACVDVDSPLLGDNGAARVFAPQKGASPEQVEQLEGWMSCWCDRIERNIGRTLCNRKGAGAGGGLGFAIAALGGEITPGAQMIADLTGISDAVSEDALFLTDEGRFDETSFHGKAPWVLAKMAQAAGAIPVIVCAVADDSAVKEAKAQGVEIIQYAAIPGGIPREQSASYLRQTVTDYLRQHLADTGTGDEPA